jgi:MFS family permease
MCNCTSGVHTPRNDDMKRLPFFYGWIIVAVTFVTMAIGVNARTAFSLFFPPIIDEFGWERGVTAGAFSFGFLVSAAVSPLIGRLMDRAGPRAVMELGVALMAGGLLLAPLTTQPWHLYLTIGVMVGAGSVCLGYSGQSLFLPNWFIRRRGLAMGLAFAGVGIGSMTLLPWGTAHDRANRLANRLHGDGHPYPGGARADQPVAAKAPRG